MQDGLQEGARGESSGKDDVRSAVAHARAIRGVTTSLEGTRILRADRSAESYSPPSTERAAAVPCVSHSPPSPSAASPLRWTSRRPVSGGDKFDSCGGRKSDSRQHGLAA